MERTTLLKALVCHILLTISGSLFAQTDQRPAPLVLHVDGLTSTTRDAIVQDLTQDGGFRVSFACVPAGLIIVEPTDPQQSTDSLRLRMLPRVLRNVEAGRIREDHLTIEMAEERCAQARN